MHKRLVISMKIAIVEEFPWSWRRGSVGRYGWDVVQKSHCWKNAKPARRFSGRSHLLKQPLLHCRYLDKLYLCFRSRRSRLSLLWLPPPFSCSTYGNARGAARCRVIAILRPQCPAFHEGALRHVWSQHREKAGGRYAVAKA